MRTNKKLSVVICTFNRANLLPELLESLAQQTLDEKQREILLVDNGSIDDTSIVTDEFIAKIPGLRYVFEPEIGLSAARNRGWREAKGEYIGFIDDDCKAPPEWLQVAVEIMDKIGPQAFGGPYYAYYNGPKQKWIKDGYFSHIQSEIARPLNKSEYLDGMNMFIHRELFESLGGFPLNLGMVGNKIAYGEETQFIKKLRAHTPQAIVYYDPRLFVYHLVRAEKMELRQAPRYFFIEGRYSYRVFNKSKKQEQIRPIGRFYGSLSNIFMDCLKILYTMARIVKDCTWGVINRNRLNHPFIENYLYECGFKPFFDLGHYVEDLCRILGLKEQE